MANVNTTTVTQGVMPGLEGLVSPLAQGALDAYNMPFPSYGGRLVAPFTTDQRSAFDRIAGNVNNRTYEQAFNNAMSMAQGAGTPSAQYQSALAGLGSPVGYQSVTAPTVAAGTVNPGNVGTGQWGAGALGQYMSPYLQNVVDTTTSELDRQAGKDQAALRARLAGKGSFGDRSTLALTEQQRNADQVRANTVAQLMQGGYGQAAGLFNTDQARALQAAQSNQQAGLQGGIANLNADLTANLNNASNSLGAQRANQSTDLSAQQLYRQGLGQVAGLDVSNRGLGTQAAQALGSLGSNAQTTNLAGLQALLQSGSLQQQQQQAQDTSTYNQFLRQIGYPQQQVGNLAGILYGAPKGSTTTTPAPSDLQTGIGLGSTVLGALSGTGAFGTTNPQTGATSPGWMSNGFDWLSSLFADGGRIGYADGGEIDEEDDDDVSAFGPLDDDEDEAAGDDGDPQAGAGSVAAGLNAFGEPAGDGGGDGSAPAEGGGGSASLSAGVRTSGYTNADLAAKLAEMQPRAIGPASFFGGGIDNPLTALGLGILASKSPHLGEALGQGGLAALSRISAQKKEQMALEQLRQKGVLTQAQMMAKGLEGDRKSLNEADKTQFVEKQKGERSAAEIAGRKESAGIHAGATRDAAATRAAATRYSADAHAAAATPLIKNALALGLKPGSDEFNDFIKKGSETKHGKYVSLGNGVVMDRETGETKVIPEAKSTGQPLNMEKAIAERDRLKAADPNNPNIKIWDDYIQKLSTTNNGVDLTLPDGTKLSVGGSGKGAGPQSGLQPGNQKEVEKELIEQAGQLMQVNRIAERFDPKFQTIAEKARAGWTALKDKAGFRPSADEAKALEGFTAYRGEAAQFFADRLKAMSGAAVTEGEAKRQTAYLPDPGTGTFDGDSPTQMQSKLKRMQEFFGKATARLNYIRKNGLSIENVPLDKMGDIMNERGRAIADQLRAQKLDDEQVKALTKQQLAREFGLLGN